MQQAGRDATEIQRRQALIQDTLRHLAWPEEMPLPAHLVTLTRRIADASTPEEAELFIMELRREVHLQRETDQAVAHEADQAAHWLFELEALPEAELPPGLYARLRMAAAGLARLDDGARDAARGLLASLTEARKKTAAKILERSLQDLGYQVEDIAETLFVEGGVMHFQRPGWEDYFVRMKVDTEENHFNFNVVRTKFAEKYKEENQLMREDFMAEERWCAEMPKLLKTLETRGIALDMTRQMAAGSLPLQEVPADSLPCFLREETHRRMLPRRHQPLPGSSTLSKKTLL
jgi:hypothetical protein